MRWIIRRTGQAIFTVWAVVTLSFVITRFMPGGPIDFMRAQLAQQGVDTRQLDAVVETYTGVNPDEPLFTQYVNYMGNVLTGDLGQSVWFNDPVAQVIREALPWTVFLMTITMVLIFGIAILLGGMMAYLEGTRFDTLGTTVSIVLAAIPYYIAAVFLLWVFSFQLGWFPRGGRLPAGVDPGLTLAFVSGALAHAILPVASMVLTGFGMRALAMRGNSISVLGEDYVRVARLRGLPRNRIAVRYVVRNAILPLYTEFMITIGFMFGGAIILETIFNYPGMGFIMFRAIEAVDQPLMMGTFLVITLAVVIAVFVADITYSLIDPKATNEGDGR